jgi:ABC-type transporter Mla subunit MlaD
MDHTALSRLSHRELLLHADNQRDPLTSTDVEIELANRFADLIELIEIDDALTEHGLERKDLRPLLELLNDFSATDLAALRQKLERADTFYDIAHDAGDVIARINTLITETL